MFSFVKNDNGGNFPIIEQKPAAAATYEIGDALKVNASGYVEKATGTTKPSFICAERVTTAKSAGAEISVNPVYAGQTWATVCSADASALKAGAKVTIASTSNKVTATTTSGVATLLTDGAVTDGAVLVKFE